MEQASPAVSAFDSVSSASQQQLAMQGTIGKMTATRQSNNDRGRRQAGQMFELMAFTLTIDLVHRRGSSFDIAAKTLS
jgi:hypothetical protein